MVILHIIACVVIAIASFGYLFLLRFYSYWAVRGVVYDEPSFFYGNLREVARTQPLRQPFREFYAKYKNVASFGGFFLNLRRAVVLLDLDLVKQVLIKDFSYFAHRGNYYNERDDPLSAHLFNLDGPKWRAMRAKLSPTFTSGKMKFMFPTIVEVAERFVKVLEELLTHEQAELGQDVTEIGVEVKELLARFTTDVIGTCAFGLECNSLKDPNTKFRLMGKKSFTKRRHGRVVFLMMQAYPDLARKLGMRALAGDVHDFFMGVVRETVAYRERERVQRNDFMNLLIDLKNNNETEGLTLEEVAAQAFVFFLAGFETSSSTMGFCLYELAKNQDIQDQARAEISEMFKRYNGKLTYEGVRELKYLQQILHETLRMYSILSVILRKTVKDYQVPNTRHVIEKDTVVVIPVDAIHNDPDIYDNPEVFDPERFTAAEVAKRHPMAWLPFGEGQRNCIGLRFGEMQALVGLTLLLKNFKFSVGKETKTPLEMDVESVVLSSKDGIILGVEKI